jgi:dTDP-4-dehydrorhamnose 3,5-epimerase
MFKDGKIEGVITRNLVKHSDGRGWLTEIFREDEIDPRYAPVMAYISMTVPGVVRGPHEHVDQADMFCFLGPSTFKVYLWDNRKESPSYMVREIISAGEEDPRCIIIPPGVAHAYRNVGDRMGMVVNCPNRLYAGKGKKEPVDEIRHEADPTTIFVLD